MSLSTAVTKRDAETALMPPPPPPKRIKRPTKVLSEDDYTSALSHIIARDFFPGLLETEAQEQYLEALDSGDQEWIDATGRRVQAVMTPVEGVRGRRGVIMTPSRGFEAASATPRDWTGATASARAGDATPRPEKGRPSNDNEEDIARDQDGSPVDLNLGLTAFQAKYTSEDNESFNALLDKQNEKWRSKYGWLWNRNKLPSKQQIAHAASRRPITNGSAAPRQGDPGESEALTILDAVKDSDDDRPVMIDSAHVTTNPRNGLMFLPEDLETTHPRHITQAQAAQDASRAAPRSVAYTSTRLPATAFPSEDSKSTTIPPSPSISAIDAAIRGQPYPTLKSGGIGKSSAVTGADSKADGGETPRVNGFAFVDAEPTPSEIDFAEGKIQERVDHNALLTQLIKSQHGAHGASDDGTPSGPNPFSIAPSSRREIIHHRMVEKQSKAKRAPSQFATATPVLKNKRLGALMQSGKTPTPKFASSPRIGSRGIRGGGKEGGPDLTPAARALYEKIGRTPARPASEQAKKELDGHAFGRKKGHGLDEKAWTPTPLRVRRAV